ncbi:MAG: PP2C family serine/threonine-protein phosphatase [Rhodanobacter sp.]
MSWRIYAASAKGSSHVAGGLPCQDASASAQHGDWLVALVCDGAGSAISSHIGSSYIAREVCRRLTEDGAALSRLDTAAFGAHIATLLAEVRDGLEAHADKAQAALRDYAATVVGAVMGPTHGWFFHIGDGLGIARHANGSTISVPENGEYANETFFLSGNEWHAHLRITTIEQATDRLMLMSDGAMPFVMAKGQQQAYAAFIDPVQRFLEQAGESNGSKALAATLDDPRTLHITNDDKTLLIALPG